MKIFLFNPLYTFDIGNGYEKYFIRSGSRWPHSGIKKRINCHIISPFHFIWHIKPIC